VLIDFGAARKDVSKETKSIMVFFSPAYAAPEQIHAMGNQGPWTDIYGLAATLYKAVTGVVPTNAAKRLQNETYIPAVEAAEGDYRPAFLKAIDTALNLLPKNRPQSVAEWKERFDSQVDVHEDEEKTLLEQVQVPAKTKKYQVLLAVIAIAMALGAVNWWNWFRQPDISPKSAAEFNKELPPIRAQLNIDSVPAAASVFLNAEFKGKTPLSAEVAAGTYSLRLSLENYHNWESMLLIEQQGDIPIRIPLLKIDRKK
jgi:serine/threonine protein kinase